MTKKQKNYLEIQLKESFKVKLRKVKNAKYCKLNVFFFYKCI